MNALPIRLLAGLLLFGGFAAAQAPEQRLAAQRHLLKDWGGLIRYGSEDAEIPPPKPGENRVVFLGDDVTDQWGQGAATFFPGKPYLNRGIAGQTSAHRPPCRNCRPRWRPWTRSFSPRPTPTEPRQKRPGRLPA